MRRGLVGPLVSTILLCGRAGAADEIHWTMTSDTSASFDWRGCSPELRYGPTPHYGSSVVGVRPNPKPFSSRDLYWEARVGGLHPNTVYHYSIDAGPDHVFHTLPGPGTPFTVYAEGDVGDAVKYPAVAPVQALIAAAAPSFVLVLGDLTYGDQNGLASVDRHFNDVMGWSQDAAYMPIWGNHDWSESDSTDNLRNYTGRFDLPNPQASPGAPAVSCCGEDWYWFDAGRVRFIAFPEPYPRAWADWKVRAAALMDQAQADPGIRFIVTFGHRPAYSSGYHAGAPQLAAILDSLGSRHDKYVLALSGHSHDYERTVPQFGVTHVTAGIGGSTLEALSAPCLWAGGCPPPAWSAFRAYHHGVLRLEFGPNSIRGEAICGPSGKPNDIACNPGEVFDSFTIGHDGPPIITGLPPSVIDSVGRTLSLEVRASDPDGDPIDSLTADLTGLPSGNDAVFSPRPGNASGRLTWTPSIRDTGTYRIEFRAVNALAATASIVVGVRAAPIASSVAAASLAVEDVHPNPAASGLTLAYSSAGGEAPRLELLDVAGRAVVRLDLGRQAPGHHVAELKRPANLPPGLYWLRLAQSGHAVFARIVFMP